MFHGLSAFPLTPLKEGKFDERAFINLLRPVVDASVDSLGILGSTGSYAYLTVEERGRIARCAVAHAYDIPVIISIGALRLDDILRLADDGQAAGVSGVLMAPVSYQRLTEDETFNLYETVTRQLSVPLCIYDNPATTGFAFSDELLFAVAALPNVGSIKLGRVPEDLSQIRDLLPDTVTLGIAGDWLAASALQAGFDVWYSVLAGLFPHTTLAIARSKEAAQSERLEPLWELFRRYGSLRVIAAAAEMMGKVAAPVLPFPLQAVQGEPREALARILADLELA
ncbi:dihydrodipicolinate synthase family protein [Enterobacter sp. V87_3]|uniref:dihydrodipicolinate synthase family protein n=1 Tax=Enterobacter sp. V87_3 TaxID=3044236 RepID=UPI00249F3CCF|nr:dihydrodipicolinate synthase family protein [Enterobacter sp. V87_3]MDI3427045.1 dihydrodipicolinate synthase family protein [Enterobacter sp. V87_3]HDS6852141.1 dihydrodipicolinate synthase family protein [Enterobacter cancerogenus]